MMCFVLGLSIILFPLLETGHEILHHIENGFHHHHVGHHHTLADHHVKQHRHDDGQGETELTDYIVFVPGFYGSARQVSVSDFTTSQHHNTGLISFYISHYISPPTVPPKD
jgi:hypothetical protein